MELSNKNAIAQLRDLNQDIEEYAETTVKNVVDAYLAVSLFDASELTGKKATGNQQILISCPLHN